MKPVYLKGYILLVTFIHRFAGTTNSLQRYARITGSQSTGLLEPLAPCGGVPKLLAPREVTSINSKGRFPTTGDPCP
jgi:hypothetical protein